MSLHVAGTRRRAHRETGWGVSTATKARTGIVIGALGVVFGDIGTSPIYTVQTLFNPGDPHPVPITPPTSTAWCR